MVVSSQPQSTTRPVIFPAAAKARTLDGVNDTDGTWEGQLEAYIQKKRTHWQADLEIFEEGFGDFVLDVGWQVCILDYDNFSGFGVRHQVSAYEL